MAAQASAPGVALQMVRVCVPATTANMGPGFDALGMALDLWNEVTLELSSSFSVFIEGEGADTLPRDHTNLVVRAAALAFARAGVNMPPLRFICKNRIPFGGGMGSSSAAIIGGLVSAFALMGRELAVRDHEELLQYAAELEGHVDNISACLYGGLQIGVHTGERWRTTTATPAPGLLCVVFTPDSKMATHEARALLADNVSRGDAVFNLARTALLVHALTTGNFADLAEATRDRLHQPARAKVMPVLGPAIEAALQAGAKGCFLSGAGSSILAITDGARGDPRLQAASERKDRAVATAVAQIATRLGCPGTIRVLAPSTKGAHVVETRGQSPPAVSAIRYRSTRGVALVSFEQAVMDGLAPDGGLYVPETVPRVELATLEQWRHLSFSDLALEVMSLFISPEEVPRAILGSLLRTSYASFSSIAVTPLVQLKSDTGAPDVAMLELFHGPTFAFKDVALQFLGNLFEHFLLQREISKQPHTITVLGATSGDTGGAAIHGLRGKKNVTVYILHPFRRVAKLQEAQMTSVLDANIHNVAVEGTFDDCQALVKELFNDPEFRARHSLAAINSINWARILAQIVYYFAAYFQWVQAGHKLGDPVSFSVPTGNFGDALACYYARQMGLPVKKIVVATNANDILHRFISSDDYTARVVQPTLAPAMDITVPSNFERYLFHLLDNDPARLSNVMKAIKSNSLAPFSADIMARVREIFSSSAASDAEIAATVEQFEKDYKYRLCPHTACGVFALRALSVAALGPTICLATAHPAKFLDSLEGVPATVTPPVPAALRGLLRLPRRFVLAPNKPDFIRHMLDNNARPAPLARLRPGKEVAVPMASLLAGAVLGGLVAMVLMRGQMQMKSL